MENICNFHSDHVTRIKKLEKDCEDLDDRVTDLDKSTAVNTQMIFSSLKNLEKLPETMIDISKTMVSIQNELSNSNERIGELDNKFNSLKKQINDVDEEGKFNIRKCIKDNWIGIVMGAGALIYFFNQFMS